ncbi:hypothetical protein CTEN210_12154 [Chaetoceros tenuissimus]|uniref:Uncharacterized protein n=1 Tax=Chaetoceros tenuissimus TaxID=426638 RepID=A0AAD3D0Y5_9STRA|nr:hypothetical protein CTEN210_12154 [Chaetoceros tenuissimus]
MHLVVPSFLFWLVKSIGLLYNVTYVQSLSSISIHSPSISNDDDTTTTNTLRRKQRWKSAVSTLENSIQERSRFDHRAKFARLIGIYVGDENTRTDSSRKNSIHVQEHEKKKDGTNILVAIQPDQGGRKLLFLDSENGRSLGYIELETQSAISQSKILEQQTQPDNKPNNTENDMMKTSALRGMLVANECRGKGYARLFLAIWLRLCVRGGVTPATTRINKPLLALTLVRLGFTPLRGHHLAQLSNINHLQGGIRTNENTNPSQNDGKRKRKKLKERQRPLVVEVSIGNEGKSVILYSPLSTERLRNGFSAQEIISQRLVVATEASTPRGRIVHLRVRYAPPRHMINHTATSSNDSAGSSLLDNTKSNDTYQSQSKKMIHLPLAECVRDCLRLTATQGPTTRGTPSTEEQAEAMHVLIGRI